MSSRPSLRPLRRYAAAALLVGVALGALVTSPALAQYFGRNQVQWERFDFHVLQTEHFDIYYYPERNRAVEDVARMAERWYQRLSRALGHQLSERKPIVLYADKADFQQTTISGGLIGQGVGGFTESLQNRLVMPLTGSYADTDHVLGHEMVHVFQFDILQTVSARLRNQRVQPLPLWMTEGLAEYLSLGRQHVHTAMWLRDAVLHDDLPGFDKLNRDPRYFPYRYGHAFWAYVGGRWGDPAVARLYLTALQRGIPAAVQAVLGLDIEQLFDDWHAAIRSAYQPEIEVRRPAVEQARPILRNKKANGNLYLAPVISPDGERFAFLSTLNLFSIDLFVADARSGEVERRLVSAETDPHFDALRFLDSAGSWSPDGDRFAFVVFAQGDNQVAIADAARRRIDQRLEIAGADAVLNVSWSPDGRSLALSGARAGVSDLYLVDVDTGQVRRLTDDLYMDIQPSWSPDGRTLAFVSDRGQETDFDQLDYGKSEICLLDLETGRVEVLPLFDRAKHIDPQFGPDGRSLYFVADPGGISNVFRYALDEGTIYRITDVATGVSGVTELAPSLSVARQTGNLTFTVFEQTQYSVYSLEPEEARGVPVDPTELGAARAGVLPPVDVETDRFVESYLERPEGGLPERLDAAVEDYDPRLRLTFLGPPAVGVGVDRYGLGVVGGMSAYFSDVLGRHQLGVALQGGAASDDGLNVGLQGTYLNRSRRLNWAVTGAHVPYVSAFTTVRREEVEVDGELVLADVFEQIRETVTIDQAGLSGIYPLSLNRRLEATVYYSRFSFDREIERLVIAGNQFIDQTEEDLAAPDSYSLSETNLAFVGDTSFFAFTSPLKGTRYRFEVGQTFGEFEFATALADLRRYFFARPASFAVRLMHYGRYGDDADAPRLNPLFVGRETLVRGYEIGSWDLDECTSTADSSACPEFDRLEGSRIALLNMELRVQVLGTDVLGLVDAPYTPLELAAFVDAGTAWTEDETPDLRFDRETTERVPVVSAGLSARILLGGYVPLQFYWAVPFQRPQTDDVFGFFIAPGW